MDFLLDAATEEALASADEEQTELIKTLRLADRGARRGAAKLTLRL